MLTRRDDLLRRAPAPTTTDMEHDEIPRVVTVYHPDRWLLTTDRSDGWL